MASTNEGTTFSMADMEKKIDEIIEERIAEARKQLEQVRDENLALNLEVAELQKRVEALDRTSKRGCVVVKGIKNIPGTSAATQFVRLCDNLLNEDVEVVDTIRLPSGDFIFKLATTEQVTKILRMRREFKGTCYINRNLTRQERCKGYHLRKLSKKLNASKTAKVRTADFRLFVNNKAFTWDNGNLRAYNPEDAKMMNEILKECNIEMTCYAFDKPKNKTTKDSPKKQQQEQQQQAKDTCLTS